MIKEKGMPYKLNYYYYYYYSDDNDVNNNDDNNKRDKSAILGTAHLLRKLLT
jgi:hypothetical protein